MYQTSYFELLLEKNKITEPALVSFVSEKLDETVKHCKNDDVYNNFRRTDYSTITVGIKSGLFVKYRKLCITNAEYDTFYENLYSSEEVKKIYTHLPEYDKYSSFIEMTESIDEKKSEELYNSLRDELKTVNPADWAELVNTASSPVYILMQTIVDDRITFTTMPLNILTPKTLLLYANTVNSSVTKDDAEQITNLIELTEKNKNDNRSDKDIGYSVNINVLSDDFKSIESFCNMATTDDEEDDEPPTPVEIYGITGTSDSEPDYIEYDEDIDNGDRTLLASVYDTTEITDFVKECFSNPADIEFPESGNFKLVSVQFMGYNYSYNDSIQDSDYFSDGTDKTVYAIVEADKIEQFIAAHGAGQQNTPPPVH